MAEQVKVGDRVILEDGVYIVIGRKTPDDVDNERRPVFASIMRQYGVAFQVQCRREDDPGDPEGRLSHFFNEFRDGTWQPGGHLK